MHVTGVVAEEEEDSAARLRRLGDRAGLRAADGEVNTSPMTEPSANPGPTTPQKAG